MNRLLTTSLCLLAIGGLAAESVASTPEQRAERRDKCLAQLKEKHPEVYQKIDKNGDGEISGPEFGSFLEHREAAFKEKHPELFAAIDGNGDGDISKEEMKAARDARDAKFKAAHPQAFDKADKNDDGELQRREAAKAREQHHEKVGEAK